MTSCPHCGAPTEPGQLVCIHCGGRLALEQSRRRETSFALIAALLALIVVGAGAFGFALSELTRGDDEPEQVAATTPAETSPADTPATPTETAAGEAQQPTRSLLLEWPDDLTAHTVVLVTTSDRPAARRLARQAARSGIEAGLLRSDDYDLGTGLWIVFAGRFDTLEGAQRQATDLGERYPGAYAQLIQPAGG